MITTVELREHVLTAAEKYDLPLTVKQADTLANHLTIHANRGAARTVKLTDVQMAALVGLASGETAAETGRTRSRRTGGRCSRRWVLGLRGRRWRSRWSWG
jgi:hypothetical protein